MSEYYSLDIHPKNGKYEVEIKATRKVTVLYDKVHTAICVPLREFRSILCRWDMREVAPNEYVIRFSGDRDRDLLPEVERILKNIGCSLLEKKTNEYKFRCYAERSELYKRLKTEFGKLLSRKYRTVLTGFLNLGFGEALEDLEDDIVYAQGLCKILSTYPVEDGVRLTLYCDGSYSMENIDKLVKELSESIEKYLKIRFP